MGIDQLSSCLHGESKMIFHEAFLRTAAKATTWRLLGTLVTALLVWVVSRRWQVALAVGGIEAVSKAILYVVHERLWNHFSYLFLTRKQ